jgi:predicted MFS family arabinose efflux permease
MVVPRSARNFLVAHKVHTDRPREPARASIAEAIRVWTERRSIQIGIYVFAFTLAEGAATDWIGVAIVDGHEVSPKWGTLGFAMFLASVTTARWLGGGLLSRYGRVTVLRGLSGVAIAGVLLFVFGPSLSTTLAGVLLWGVGIALGYPVGISAGAENSDKAAARVSTISTIGKVANFAGPPLIGLLGSHNTVRYALLLLVPLQCIALVFAGALRSSPADT